MSGPVDTGRVGSIKDSSRKPFRILSLDGGGVRAIIQATLLQRLNILFPNMLDEVDMYAGSSAGSIVASALCNGLTPDQTYAMWMETAPKIFLEGYLRKITSIDSVIGSSYDANILQQNLSSTIGEKKLKDLPKKILIPSFNLDPPGHGLLNPRSEHRWQPEYFHNFPDSESLELPLMDAVLRSAAAPTYFPIRDGYVDGGTFANNPAMAAISTAINNGIRLEDIVVLSISTGNNPRCVPKKTYGEGNWGLAQWGPHVIDLLLDSTTQSLDYSCKCLLRDQYMRVDPILAENVSLDDATSLKTLSDVANSIDLTDITAWMDKFWKTSSAPSETKDTPQAAQASTKPYYCAIM